MKGIPEVPYSWPHDSDLWVLYCKCKECGFQKRMWEIDRWIRIKFFANFTKAEAPQCRVCSNERRANLRRQEANREGRRMRPYNPARPSKKDPPKFRRTHWYERSEARPADRQMGEPCRCVVCGETKTVADFSPSEVQCGHDYSEWFLRKKEGKVPLVTAFKGGRCRECARARNKAKGRREHVPLEHPAPPDAIAGCLSCKAQGKPAKKTVAEMAKVSMNLVKFSSLYQLWLYPYCKECFNAKSRAGVASATP